MFLLPIGVPMPEHAQRPRRHVAHGPLHLDEDHRLGEEAMHFTRWFLQSKYALMAGFLGELRRAPDERDAARIQERFCRALRHAERTNRARGVVTLLLALGVVATGATSVANLVDAPELVEGDVAATATLLERAAAVAASASILLVAMRLLLDRYLERIDVAATFLAMQLATTVRPTPRGAA